MKFGLSVAPLKDAMNLGIISSNISKFFEKSTVIELNAEGDTLRLNTQATSLLSESYIKGDNQDGGIGNAIVDCLLFQKLIDTIDTSEIVLDFQDNVLTVQSGKSSFNVPKLMTDEDDVSLDRPVEVGDSSVTELHPETWKYIQDHQLYALALSQINRAYTRVWVSPERGALTGDPSMSFFTYQPSCDLDSNCLVSSTIVNLMAMMEPGAELYHIDDSNYVVKVHTDSFEFVSQFTVDHEDKNGMGEYGADMIFDMVLNDANTVDVSLSKLNSVLKQATLFSSASDPLITLESSDKGIKLVNDNVNCKISNDTSSDYSVSFKVQDISLVVSHMDGDTVSVSPIIKEGEVFGERFKSNDLVALLGGVEE